MDGTSTRLRGAAAALVESTWLAALIATPLLFNSGAERAFEEPKILLLRSLAGVIAAGVLAYIASSGRAAAHPHTLSIWRSPVVAAVLLVTVAYAVSTAVSIDPGISFWGAYRRAQGLYTWLGYVAFFIAILVVADRRAVDRLVTIGILSSLVPAAYAVLQHFGADPFRWDPLGDRIGRVAGTAGNPIFLSAFLIMIVPLTLARLLSHATGAREDRGSAVLYAVLFVVQVVAILYSRSMGPLVALGAGLTLFGVVCAFLYRSRAGFVALVCGGVAGLLFLRSFSLPDTPFEPLLKVPYLNDTARIARIDHGTNAVRIMIWEGTLDLLAADPRRDLIGYGPDVMPLVYAPYYPPQLIDFEAEGAVPDRAHNQTLESLVTIGVAGWMAQLLLFASLFLCALRRLGIVATTAQRRSFLILLALGASLGVIVPRLVEGSFVFCALGLGIGIGIATLVFVIASVAARWPETARVPSSDDLLVAAALAAIFAHFIEIQVGIGVVATELCFFAAAAVVVLLGAGVATSPDRRSVNEIVQQGSIVAVGLIVLMFDFFLSNPGVTGAGWVANCLLATAWLGGGIVVLSRAASGHMPGRRKVRRYILASAVPSAAFAVLSAGWNATSPASGSTVDHALALGAHLAHANTALYAGVLLCIALPAIVARVRNRAGEDAAIARPGWALLTVAAALAGAIFMIALNLAGARADSLAGLAAKYADHGEPAAATALYEAASRLQPAEETYAIGAARARLEGVSNADKSASSEAELSGAEAVLQHTATLNPLNPQAPWNLARLHGLWASRVADPKAETGHIEQADRYYAATLALLPHDSNLWNEWAAMHRNRGELDRAMDIVNQSLAMHERWTTYCLRGGIYLQQGAFESALQDYDSALRLKTLPVEALSGKAAALAGLGRIDEAIPVGRLVAERAPQDPLAQANLALLYRQGGQLQAAIASAQAALQLAGLDERPSLQQLVQQLTAELASTTAPQ